MVPGSLSGVSLSDGLALYKKNLFVALSSSQVVPDGDAALPCSPHLRCPGSPAGFGLQHLALNGPFILTTEAKQSSGLIISKFYNYWNLSMTQLLGLN